MKTFISAVAAIATALTLAALPAFGHGGTHAEAPNWLSDAYNYIPYSGGIDDPLGITSPAPAVVHMAALNAAGGTAVLVDKVRAANARFADVNVAVLEGYSPIPCVSGIEGGAMGIHYVNGTLIGDEAVDIGKPEAVMYEPQADGSMDLVAVEYITTKGPAQLGGHLFSFSGSPNRYGLPAFYELHVWAWRDNPTGATADMNPNVSCAAAFEQAQ